MGDGPFQAAAAAVTPPDANALDARDGETAATVLPDAAARSGSVRDAGALHNPLAVAASLQLLLDSGCGVEDDRLWPYIVRLAELTGLRRRPASGGTAAETPSGARSLPSEADRVRLLRAGVAALRKAARGTAVDAELADLLHGGGSESGYDNHATGKDTLWMPGWALEACWRWAATPADHQPGRAVAWPDPRDLYRLLAEREARIAQRARERMTALHELSADASADIGLRARIEAKQLRLLERQRALRHEALDRAHQLFAPVPTDAMLQRYRRPHDVLERLGVTEPQAETASWWNTARRAVRAREHERGENALQRREQENRRRARQLRYLENLIAHVKVCRDVRAQINGERQSLNRAVHKWFRDRVREEERRARREEQERIRALRANDEEAYLQLLDTAKSSRIMEVLQQTDRYLMQIGTKVQAQKDVVSLNEAVEAQGLVGERARLAARRAERENREHATQGPPTAAAVSTEVADAPPADGQSLDDMRRRREEYYQLTHSISEVVDKQPSTLSGGTLKPYQVEGLQWMVSLYNNNLNGILADEMGLGKTIQTIALLVYLAEHKDVRGPHLIVVPLSTLSNWVREFGIWAPHFKMVVYRGDRSARRAIQQYEMAPGSYNVLLTTYEYCVRDQRALSRIFWKYIIVDEGHRMKNTHCRLAMTLGVKYRSRNRLLLTGTPLQNSLTELWALLNFLLPTIFSSCETFESWFSAPFQSFGAGDQPDLTDEEILLVINRLHSVLRPFLLRRLKTDVENQLPEKRETMVRCDLSIWQKILYRQTKNNIGVALNAGGKSRLFNNIVMQLKKVCNHPYLFYDWEELAALDPLWVVRASGKFELLDRILPKLLRSGHRVLLFSQMTIAMDVLEDLCQLRHFKYLRLDGTTKAEERQEMLERFNEPDSDIFLFMLSTRAGGLGLNLQAADTVILFDSDWNPQADLQAQDRAHRIGQKKEVRVFRLLCSDTVEERILAEANRKLNMDRQVIQAGKFNQKATDEERQEMLEDLLRQQESNEAAGDVPDDETLNEMLARSEQEVELFERMDAERAADPEIYPPLMTDEAELPSWVRQPEVDAEASAKREMIAAADFTSNYGRGRRRRERDPSGRLQYGDGLTEREWLRVLEIGQMGDDLENAIREKLRRKELKRERQRRTLAKKKMMRMAAAGAMSILGNTALLKGGKRAARESHRAAGKREADARENGDWEEEEEAEEAEEEDGRRRVRRRVEEEEEEDASSSAAGEEDASSDVVSDDDDEEDDDDDDAGRPIKLRLSGYS